MIGDTWYPSWAADGKLYSPWTDGFRTAPSRRPGPAKKRPRATPQSLATIRCTSPSQTPASIPAARHPTQAATPAPISFTTASGTLEPIASTIQTATPRGAQLGHFGTVCRIPLLDRLRKDLDRHAAHARPPALRRTGQARRPAEDGRSARGRFWKEHAVLAGRQSLPGRPRGDDPDAKPRAANLSWVTGDQIYMARVLPSPQNMNDASKYEFFAGHDAEGNPIWTHDFAKIKPLVDWNNNCGGAAITYNPGLKKYLLCINDGGDTVSKMNTYILESDRITGPWKLVVYMRNFGEQAYFANIPSKFISADGRTAWLCYSANFTNVALPKLPKVKFDPPAGHAAGEAAPMVWQEIKLLPVADVARKTENRPLPNPCRGGEIGSPDPSAASEPGRAEHRAGVVRQIESRCDAKVVRRAMRR